MTTILVTSANRGIEPDLVGKPEAADRPARDEPIDIAITSPS